MHRSGKAADEPAIEVVQVVGYINVDLDTPTPVLREFIRRFCGGWLNEHAKVSVTYTYIATVSNYSCAEPNFIWRGVAVRYAGGDTSGRSRCPVRLGWVRPYIHAVAVYRVTKDLKRHREWFVYYVHKIRWLLLVFRAV